MAQPEATSVAAFAGVGLLWRGWRAEPFVAVQNALDQSYVGSVTLNGAFARVLESAPRRNWYVGLELGAPLIR